jgi:rod shape-determining protein MreC
MRRRFLPYLLILAAVIIFIGGHARIRAICTETTYPFQRVLKGVGGQFSSRLSAAWRGLCDGPSRDTSAIEIDRLRVMLATFDDTIRENAHLRELLEWRTPQPPNVVAAPVWSHGGGLGVWPRLQLAAGSLKGIQVGDTVLVPEGLVGRIADSVTLHTSEVILLSDPACRVAAEVVGGVKGVVQGDLGDDFGTREDEPLLYTTRPLRMNYIARNVMLQPGQVLYTEGSGGLFPRGLKIGTISERREPPASLLSDVLVEPAVHPTSLRTVFVLTRPPMDKETDTP